VSATLIAALPLALSMPGGVASAQSPTPTEWMESHNDVGFPPAVYPYVTVVQGDEFCDKGGNSAALSALEQWTVKYLQQGKAVVSEITLYGPCGYSDATYENDVTALRDYVEANGPAASQKWLGVMLDEEHGYGIAAADLEAINASVTATMATTPGATWWFNEIFAGTGDYTQATFNALLSQSTPAPQVYTTGMANYVNSSGASNILVTWFTGTPGNLKTQAASVGAINGSPYVACPYVNGTECRYMSNEFIPS
jgi:hypothetical protein